MWKCLFCMCLESRATEAATGTTTTARTTEATASTSTARTSRTTLRTTVATTAKDVQAIDNMQHGIVGNGIILSIAATHSIHRATER